MPRSKQVPADPQRLVEINVVSQSPHVVAYRIWSRPPGGTWATLAEGHTGDAIPDFNRVGPFPRGSEIAYWLGIGGNPRTSFHALVTLGQDGKILPDGACPEIGKTDADGVAVREEVIGLT